MTEKQQLTRFTAYRVIWLLNYKLTVLAVEMTEITKDG